MARTPSRLRASLRISRPEAFAPLTAPAAAGGQTYTTRAWQVAAWDAYDEVPESHATTAFIAACLSRLKFKLAWLGDDDEPGDVWDEEGNVKEGINPAAAQIAHALVRSLRAKRGGSTRLLYKIGANMAQVGDLTVVPRESDGGRRYFDAYSIDELRPNGDGTWQLYSGPGRQAEVFGKTPSGKPPLVIRLHREHPRFGEWADSGTRALLPTLELMKLLTQEMRASTVSRIMGKGILWVSEDADLPADPNDPEREGLTAQLATVGSVAIREPGSAAAQVPVIVRVPGKPADMYSLTEFASPDLNTIEKRDAAVNTFARGAELPVEQVIGMSKANHWGAWMIDETTAKVYIAPLMEIINGILTDDYLLSSLKLAGIKPDVYERFCIHYDDAALVVPPDRSAAAQEAHGTSAEPNLAISDQAYRDARGFSEGDAPDDDEIERRLAIAERLRRSSASTRRAGDAPPGGGPGAVNPGPPAASGASVSPETTAQAELLTRLAAAVEVAAERAVDRLGARLRSAAQAANGRMPASVAESIAGRSSREVPVLLGPDVAAALIAPDQQFVGEFAALERTVAGWMTGNPAAPRVARNVVVAAEGLARSLAVVPEAKLDPVTLVACVREV